MRRNRAQIPTIERINSLYEAGDYQELQKINETLAKRSNERMRQLEKADLDTTAAYKRAQDFISDSDFAVNKRFSRSKKMDIDSLYDQIKSESNFLRWQTSTVAGEQKRREEIFKSLTEQHIDEETGDIVNPAIDLPTNMDIDVFKKKFLEFLDTGAWEELKKHIYSKNILNEAGEAISAGASVEELTQAVKDYVNKDTEDDLLTIWDNWNKVATNETDTR